MENIFKNTKICMLLLLFIISDLTYWYLTTHHDLVKFKNFKVRKRDFKVSSFFVKDFKTNHYSFLF